MKSNVSDQIELAQLIYIDACAKCIANVSDLRDLNTIRSRVEKEGLSFLTITLPNFAKDFERSLAIGKIDSTFFPSFRKNGPIPAFLQGMTSLLFDRESGRIYEQSTDPDSDSSVIVDCVRQICRAFSKIELACTPQRVQAAIRGFAQIEHEFDVSPISDEIHDVFRRVSSCLWDNLLASISLESIPLRHGPGATAEGIHGNRKYSWRSWYERLEPYFPFIDNVYSINAVDGKEFELVTFVPAERELPVKVTPVPKTLKGPRIIAIEPCCMQYAQQALRSLLYEVIERHPLTRGHVNFRDQDVNRTIALTASRDLQSATIDLSDASDRVPRSLALSMFDGNPDLRDAIDACRSTHAALPNGTILGPLKKFASMGSALCFPVEAMYFYTICIASLLEIQNLPVNHANVKTVSRDVYVYGDDIIVPTKHAISVLNSLQKYNCKVNMHKSFWSGSFRESCGMDAFNGEQVTPVYIRQTRPENRLQAGNLVSWVATANLFYMKGYWKTASYMFKTCEKYLGILPYVSSTSPALGRITFSAARTIERWNSRLHRFEFKAWTAEPVYRTDKLEGYAALNKSFTFLAQEFNPGLVRDPLHLERSARHGAVTLRRRWLPTLD